MSLFVCLHVTIRVIISHLLRLPFPFLSFPFPSLSLVRSLMPSSPSRVSPPLFLSLSLLLLLLPPPCICTPLPSPPPASPLRGPSHLHSAASHSTLIEFIEWTFVFILVAPGTFPALGCLLLSCAAFFRRRFTSLSPESSVARSLSQWPIPSSDSLGVSTAIARADVGDTHGHNNNMTNKNNIPTSSTLHSSDPIEPHRA